MQADSPSAMILNSAAHAPPLEPQFEPIETILGILKNLWRMGRGKSASPFGDVARLAPPNDFPPKSCTTRFRPMLKQILSAIFVSLAVLAVQPQVASAQVGGVSFQGVWAQSPAYQGISFDGTRYQTVIVLELKQKNATISGTARKYLSTWDRNGNPVLVNFDMGSPGKVSGSANASGMAIRIERFGETKVNLAYTLTLGSDLRTLINNNAGPLDPASFVR